MLLFSTARTLSWSRICLGKCMVCRFCRCKRPGERWCGRWESNPHEPFRPCGFSCRLRLSPPARGARFAVWTIPSPSPGDLGLRCCPSSLYTFPAEISLQGWLGIAIAGFPDFGQFCIAGFPASTQVSSSPLRMPFRHARTVVNRSARTWPAQSDF